MTESGTPVTTLGLKLTFPIKVTAVSKYGHPSITGYFQSVTAYGTISIGDYPDYRSGDTHVINDQSWDVYLTE